MANKTLPTAEQLRRLFHYDPETGILTRKIRVSNSFLPGEAAGTIRSDGYLALNIGNRVCLLHRVAWCWMTGEWPPDQIDHKNLVRCDNRWENLRLSDNAGNNQNQLRRKNNTSGYKGVCWDKDKQKWVAQIRDRSAPRHIGRFDTPEEAYAAYCKAAVELHGEFANLG